MTWLLSSGSAGELNFPRDESCDRVPHLATRGPMMSYEQEKLT